MSVENKTDWSDMAVVAMHANRVAYVEGAPGIGKTARARSVHARYWGARADSMPFITLMPALSDPTDFAGLTFVVDGETRRVAPSWVNLLVKHKGGTVFIDEATLASPATWSALLRFVLEKVVGDVVLPEDTRIIMAGNPVAMTTAGNEFPPAGANRVVHLKAHCPDATDWASWLLDTMSAQGDRESIRAAALVGNFIKRFREHLLAVPKDESKRSGAWPSPRSWHAAAELYAAALKHGSIGMAADLVGATVGEGLGTAFSTYVTSADLPDARDVLTGKVVWHPDAARPDRSKPMLDALCFDAAKGACRDNAEREYLVEECWKLVLAAANTGLGDFVMRSCEPLQTWRARSKNPRASFKAEGEACMKLFPVASVK